MKRKLFLPLCFLATTTTAFCQGLTIGMPQHVDTTGMSPTEWRSVEKTVSFTLPNTGSSSDTLVVEMGDQPGVFELFERLFPLSETGVFNDGASLEVSSNGLAVGLGAFTGVENFHVRAYLRSTGIGGAAVLSD